MMTVGTNTCRFGPAVYPGITPCVATWDTSAVISAAVRDGCIDQINAAIPVANGVAIDVPSSDILAVSEVFQAERMFWPGANTSTQPPKLENVARLSEPLNAVAPTTMALRMLAGENPQASALAFPAATL
jgi:hypothetical protein